MTARTSPRRAAEGRHAHAGPEAERRKRDRVSETHLNRIAELESRINKREARVKTIETRMTAPEFYDERERSKPVIDGREALMCEVGDLMAQREAVPASAGHGQGGN